jgi:3-oxoacyl-[acyl-carrier-protein] synthase III
MKGTWLHGLEGVSIRHVSAVFPNANRVVDNAQIHNLLYGEQWEQIFKSKQYDPDFIKNNLGCEQRYWAHVPGTPIIKDEITSADLMVEAGNKLFSETGLPKAEIDLVIAVTVTSPKYTNSMGAYVAGALGLECPALEVKTGCASALYAIVMAAQFIRSGARNVLVTAGETPTKVTGKTGNLIYAVGDAGAAVLLSKAENNKGIETAFLGTAGKYSGAMGSIGLLPPNQADLDSGAYEMIMGKESEQFIYDAWKTIPQLLYRRSGLTNKDITCLVPHQVNKKLLELVIESAQMEPDATINIINKYANCGSVGVLLALEACLQKTKQFNNKKIMMVAVGGGVSYGGLIVNL